MVWVIFFSEKARWSKNHPPTPPLPAGATQWRSWCCYHHLRHGWNQWCFHEGTEIPTFPESQWSYVSSPTWLVKFVYGKCRWKYIPYIESLGLENMSVHVTKTPPEKLTYSSSTWKEAGPKRTCHLPTIRTVSFRVPGIRIFCQRDVFFKLRVLRTSCWTL